MLPDEVVSVNSVSCFTWVRFSVTGMYIIIINRTYSIRNHNVIIVLVKFLLRFMFIIDMLDENRGCYACFWIFIDDDDDDDDDEYQP